MTLDSHALQQRIRLGEDSTLELKQIVFRGAQKIIEPHPDGLSDELAAFANANGGTLVLGVDDKTLTATGIPSEQMETLKAWLRGIVNDRITPPLEILTENVELPNAAGEMVTVIVVSVPRSLWIHESANGYFRRVADSKRKLTPDVLARLFQQRSQARLIRFEEQGVADTSLNDADALLLRRFLRQHEGDERKQLQRLHLTATLEGQECLSVAGVLLCTEKPVRWLPSAYIQAVAYSGVNNDPNEQLDAKDFDGPLDRQLWDAFDFVRLNMKVPARKDLGRIDYPQYSLRAVFEALVNAVVHRDYSIWGGRIRLHMFADRLELYSPGALPNSMTVEAMQSMSLPRNDVLSSLFARYYPVRDNGLGREYLMDRRGSGVDVILAESEKLSGKKPLIEMIADMELRVTIYAADMVDR